MDEKRILSKIDKLDSYLEELEKIKPAAFDEYKSSISTKRAVERLLHVSIETIVDICNIIFSELKLGLPSEEEDVFKKLNKKGVITDKMGSLLNEIKGFRNILVHKYGEVDDERVYENLENLEDFSKFKDEILKFLRKS